MNLRPEVSAIVMEAIDREVASGRHLNSDGSCNRQSVRRSALQMVEAANPLVAAEFQESAVEIAMERKVNEYFQQDKRKYSSPGARKKNQISHLREWIAFRNQDNVMVTKRRIEVTKAEVPYVIQHLNKHRAAFDRDIDWWGDVYMQMRLADAGDEATVGDFVSEVEASSAA